MTQLTKKKKSFLKAWEQAPVTVPFFFFFVNCVMLLCF